jgi:hypothetical protein
MPKKTSVTQSIRAASLLIITTILTFGYQSIRKLAKQHNLSKSSVHRHLNAYQRRNQHPESPFWETAAGGEFLQRLCGATLYLFGLKHHVGADQLSEFFRLLRIDTHVGVSASALREQMRGLEKHLADFQQAQEASATCPEPARTVAMDETFFSQMMVLVMMDLPSNYLLLEEAAPDRGYDTWEARTCARLDALGLTVKQAVSDRAKALIKLALKGWQCPAGADLFHAQYDLSRWLALPLSRATRQGADALEKTRQRLTKHQQKVLRDPQETRRLEAAVKQAEQAHQESLEAQTAYRQHQQAISDSVHPFDPATGLAQDQSTVLAALQHESDEIAALAEARLIHDPKGYLKKFRKQMDDLSGHVGVWWLWINTLLEDGAPDPVLKCWVANRMMPVIYWHERLQRTKKKAQRQLCQSAWEKALQTCQDDPLTQHLPDEQIRSWQLWCEDKVKHFQRTSSAVEGRNGCLSQLYHQGRGLTPARLKALTVIHNYGTRRPDGSTPASRLFGQDFPDLFEYLLTEMKPLPLPRKRRGRRKANPLISKECPS